MTSGTSPVDLAKAFEEFNENSSTLVEAYEALQAQVRSLSDELARARDARARDLDEKERLAHRLTLLIESLPAGVVVVDRDGRVAECNPAARALFGEALTGQSWLEVVQRGFRPQPDDGHDVSLANGRRVSISTCSLGSEPGQILLFNDVTETRELQTRIAHLRRLSDIGRMAASLAHQIRTPIATALLHAGNLSGGGVSGERREQLGGRLRDVLRYMERLVKDMLDFAHTGAFEVVELEPETLCAALEHAGAAICAQRGGRFGCRCEAPGLYVQGNTDALCTVVQNLVNNAVEAGGPEVGIQLRLRGEGDELLIEVGDDGPGMDEEQARRVFEPFVSARSGGTGLGLAVAHAVVQAHGGRIDLATAPGQGARFTLALPVSRREAPPAAAGGGG
ncbi:MAG: HAMP domain-containing sensor histidine kinase [Gammaproteobacteria bacterium]|nr:HAMP domain-containing sensor histidine kinase [Gammaproteobacteria bacterium]